MEHGREQRLFIAGVFVRIGTIMKRPRLRYSVRSLLLFVLMACLFCGWVAHEIRRCRDRQDALARFKRIGVQVAFDESGQIGFRRWLISKIYGDNLVRQVRGLQFGYDSGVSFLNAHGQDHSGEDLQLVRHFPEVAELFFGGNRITNEDLQVLRDLRQIKRLYILWSPNVTDEGMANLDNLTEVETLAIDFTPVSDDGLKHLSSMSNLQFLSLAGTNVKGKGLRYLTHLNRLCYLNLWAAPFTDNGLKLVMEISKIERLELGATQITDDGVRYFAGSKTLRGVGLGRTSITDRNLEVLLNLPTLRSLSVARTQISQAGVQRLKAMHLDHLVTSSAAYSLDGITGKHWGRKNSELRCNNLFDVYSGVAKPDVFGQSWYVPYSNAPRGGHWDHEIDQFIDWPTIEFTRNIDPFASDPFPGMGKAPMKRKTTRSAH
jgi:hypothetical protein